MIIIDSNIYGRTSFLSNGSHLQKHTSVHTNTKVKVKTKQVSSKFVILQKSIFQRHSLKLAGN